METHKTRLLASIFSSVLIFVMISTICNAQQQEQGRKGKGEVFLLGQFMGGDTTTSDFTYSGSETEMKIEIDDAIAGGLGVGYNFNDHFNLNCDMFYSSTDVKASALGITIEEDIDMLGADANLDYNILKTPFTPLVTGGVGFINFSSGDSVEGESVSETDFSYNFGAGFRWDFTDSFFIKTLYRSTFTELEDTNDTLMFDGVTFNIGFRW